MKILNLGLKPYLEVYSLQLSTVEKVLSGEEDTLIICSHPPVVTLGRKAEPQEVWGWSGETIQIERGGRATYHGPSQIILYPIINLKNYGKNLEGFLFALEDAVIKTLIAVGVSAKGNPDRNNPAQTGVWVDSLKLASVGVAVKSWVTYHGMALNFYHDENAFKGINPCGKNSDIMTSVEAETDLIPERSVFEEMLITNFLQELAKYKNRETETNLI